MDFADRVGSIANITDGLALTDAEIAKINSSAVSLTTNTNAAAPTASASIYVTSEYIVVAPTARTGVLTTIQSAFDIAERAGGGAIYVQNGVYQSGLITAPNVNIKMIGQSVEGVVLKNTSQSSLITLQDITKTYSFEGFSVESQNGGVFPAMFNVVGTTATSNKLKLVLDNLNITCMDNGIDDGDYAVGVANADESSSVVLRNSTVLYGGRVFSSTGDGGGKIKILDNISFKGQKSSSIYVGICSGLTISDNSIEDIKQTGISLSSITNTLGNIVGNKLYSLTDGLASSNLVMIQSAFSNVQITGNSIRVTSTNATYTPMAIMVNAASGRKSISDNTIYMDLNTSGQPRGIYTVGLTDGRVCGNTIYISNSNTESKHHGIYLTVNSLRNIVSQNNINMVNNDAKDIGIELETGSNNNQGSDNITYNCGTGAVDNGTGNTVTTKDI